MTRGTFVFLMYQKLLKEFLIDVIFCLVPSSFQGCLVSSAPWGDWSQGVWFRRFIHKGSSRRGCLVPSGSGPRGWSGPSGYGTMACETVQHHAKNCQECQFKFSQKFMRNTCSHRHYMMILLFTTEKHRMSTSVEPNRGFSSLFQLALFEFTLK